MPYQALLVLVPLAPLAVSAVLTAAALARSTGTRAGPHADRSADHRGGDDRGGDDPDDHPGPCDLGGGNRRSANHSRFARFAGGATVTAAGVSLIALLPLADREVAAGGSWLRTGSLTLRLGLETTHLTWFISTLVALVALVVSVYSLGYVSRGPERVRYFAQFSFFVAGMQLLVLADSLVLLFAAWEFVGVASFLLIGFRFTEPAARRAATRAFVLTRLGDLGLLAGWLLLATSQNTAHIGDVLAAVSRGAVDEPVVTLTAFLMLLGALGKSAQLPLTAWLPQAMAGPTPVSALIHSATMVAAGIFLLLRLYPVFEAAPAALTAALWIGLATAFVAAIVATIQVDLKRVFAWSTASQLGEMLLAVGLGAPLAAAYHLTAHATFKSALFLSAGEVDRAAGTRDIRRLGGLGRAIVPLAVAMIVAGAALAGIPPLSGFWSEEHILAAATREGWWYGGALLALILLGGFYTGRALTAVLAAWPAGARQHQGAGAGGHARRHQGGQDTAVGDPSAGHIPTTMRAATLVMAAAAGASGIVLAVWGPSLLPFAEEDAAGAVWRIAAVAAGVGGLTGGWAMVRAWGPLAPLSLIAIPLEHGVEFLVIVPERLIALCSLIVRRMEQGLDGLALLLTRTAVGTAGWVDRGEHGLDAGALTTGSAALATAGGTEFVEKRAWGGGGDGFAALFFRAGGRLTLTQTGKLYLYTLTLFLWAGVAGFLSLYWWW